MDTRSGASASRRGRRLPHGHGRKRTKKAPDTATSAAQGSSNTDTPCAQYAPRTAPLGSPDLEGFALPTYRGSPPTGPTTTGCASDPEALAPSASTNGDGARSTTSWPVEPSGKVITPTPAAPAERTPSGAGTTGQDILEKEDLWQQPNTATTDMGTAIHASPSGTAHELHLASLMLGMDLVDDGTGPGPQGTNIPAQSVIGSSGAGSVTSEDDHASANGQFATAKASGSHGSATARLVTSQRSTRLSQPNFNFNFNVGVAEDTPATSGLLHRESLEWGRRRP